MENTKIFSFIGLEREDIPYYIAEAIAEKNRNVLVIDNSTEHSLFLSLKRLDSKADSVEEGRIIFLRNRLFSENNFEKFDVAIIYHGINVNEELLDESDRIIFMTDYMPMHQRKIKEYVDVEDIYETYMDKFQILFVDKTSGKVSEKAIKRFFEIEDFDEETILSADETDFGLRINFQYNGAQSSNGASSELRAYIKTVVNLVVEDAKRKQREEKEAEKALKNAKKGGNRR